MTQECTKVRFIEDKNGVRWPFGLDNQYRTSHVKCSEKQLRDFLTRRNLLVSNPLQKALHTLSKIVEKYNSNLDYHVKNIVEDAAKTMHILAKEMEENYE